MGDHRCFLHQDNLRPITTKLFLGRRVLVNWFKVATSLATLVIAVAALVALVANFWSVWQARRTAHANTVSIFMAEYASIPMHNALVTLGKFEKEQRRVTAASWSLWELPSRHCRRAGLGNPLFRLARCHAIGKRRKKRRGATADPSPTEISFKSTSRLF